MTGDGRGPHDAPSTAELVAAVREFLTADVLPAVEGRTRFHARVAVNVLAMVERELLLGPAQADEHAARLAELGVGDDAELARAVREGRFDGDDRRAELTELLTRAVRAKLDVANPGYPAG
ncbi:MULTISPECIES: DUF6285 domain-containing protein [Nonomuraea]|uniref:DUF6285 domain-containing protein n=1 Tax=Nonomuraea TaxID=83681 RepID=UPI001C5CEEBE|nr:DUF6285 domain-containing protein [Nonomuraea ceibae]